MKGARLAYRARPWVSSRAKKKTRGREDVRHDGALGFFGGFKLNQATALPSPTRGRRQPREARSDEGSGEGLNQVAAALIRPLLRKGHLLPRAGEGDALATARVGSGASRRPGQRVQRRHRGGHVSRGFEMRGVVDIEGFRRRRHQQPAVRQMLGQHRRRRRDFSASQGQRY